MALANINPTTTLAWQKLKQHFIEIKKNNIQSLFSADPLRAQNMHIIFDDFLVDFSKNNWTPETINLLIQLANEVQLKQAIESYFVGHNINVTESRSVLHTALRGKKNDPVFVNNKDVKTDIFEAKSKMELFCNSVISGNKKGFTNLAFTDVVNIGIGGSDLGPAMVVEALQYYKNHLKTHFISNIDGDHVQEILKKINPETTLFVIASKTFTTQETITNAETVKKWFLQTAKPENIAQHFVAISTNTEKVTSFGIHKNNIFTMWDWVGGRFSLWSTVGLTISLAIGYNNFEALLTGANKMDVHFRNTPFEQNIPVVLALLSVWHNNFYGAQTEAIIPYSQYLQKLAPYLQQGIMESNGKSVARNGEKVNYQTGTIVWGEPGSNSQHAFFQLIHQGTKLIPSDFIGFKKPLYNEQDHHNKLMSNFFAQTEALLMGKTEAQVIAEYETQNIKPSHYMHLVPFKVFEGNKPTNTILINKLTPESIGKLVAMYEHKIFVQGIIWNIYSYDQWGVELGKQLANSIFSEIETKTISKHDASTDFLLKNFLKN